MTTRIAGTVLCILILLGATGEVFADANTVMGQVSTTRLKASGHTGSPLANKKATGAKTDGKQGLAAIIGGTHMVKKKR